MKNTEKILRIARKKILIMSLIIISAIFAITLIPNSLTKVYAKNSDVIDVLNQSQNTILQDNFDENKVVVVLNQKNSRFDKTVKIEDFGIDLERAGLIRSGNLSTEEHGKNLESESEAVRTGRAVINDLFKVDNMESGRITEKSELFQILSIELPVSGKDRVFQAIEELEKSEIVYSAEPGDTVMCWYCGQIFSNPIMYTITLTNGEVFVSNVPFTFEMYKTLSSDLGLVYSYNTYSLESDQSQIFNIESCNNQSIVLPDNIQGHDYDCNYCSNDCLAYDKDNYDCFDSDFVSYID